MDRFVTKLGMVYGSMAMDDSIFVRRDRWDTSISTNKETDQPFLDYFVRKLGIVYGSIGDG